MKVNPFIIAGGIILGLLLFGNTAAGMTVATGTLNLGSLIGYNAYASADAVNRLNLLYQELQSRGYATEQILWMLAQIMVETGIFTDVANYYRMNQNNYAGLTDGHGNYLSFPTIADFCDAYIGFLTKWSNPLGGASLADFNNRLKQNGYYEISTDSYGSQLQHWYNVLVQTIGA